MSVRTWIASNGRVYHDNPSAKKDFRAQLRGNKALAVWSLYLILLMLLSMGAYYAISSQTTLSVTVIQQRLQDYYHMTMSMLAGAICLIAPALTAGSIVVEKQRKSLDLLFSAPVSLKGLLVGKMLSSYRYTWMLLVLSIPLTSVAVVMGGATWRDVLEAYAMLSFSGIVLTSIGLMFSALSETVGGAIVWTYMAVGCYLILLQIALPHPLTLAFGTTPGYSWVQGLDPFYASYAAGLSTDLGFVSVPNWILVALFSLLIGKLFLLGAASCMSPFGSAESKSFRVHVLIYVVAGVVALNYVTGVVALNYVIGGFVSSSSASIILLGVTLFLILFLPHLIAYGPDGGKKYIRGSFFDFRQALTGARSGSLPFLAMFWLALLFGSVIGIFLVRRSFSTMSYGSIGGSAFSTVRAGDGLLPALRACAWSAGFLFMWWSLGRFVSRKAKTLKSARVLMIGLMLLLIGMPIPVITMINLRLDPYGSVQTGPWSFYMLYPFIGNHLELGPIYGLIMAGVGLLFLREPRKRLPEPLEMPA